MLVEMLKSRCFVTKLPLTQTELDLDTGVPLDELTPEAVAWCRGIGCQATKLSDILNNNDEKVMKAIQEGMDR